MSNGNAVSVRRYEARMMDYFDRLPRSARVALASSRFNWIVGHYLRAFERGQSAREIVARIKRADRIESARSRAETWGSDYPILRGELRRIPATEKKASRK
ncbi:DUF6525 family protein [Rhodopseudomonas sp. G2_2311]|uniref:DUF6525 family protein n=1 Tax=Rhodopseudomonas sp. G2_2311 TaxID=3114287 RepID=UPI0039C67EA9